MKKLAPHRLVTAAIILFSISLLVASATLSWPVSAYSTRARQLTSGEDSGRRARHAQLKARLASKRPGEFQDALVTLSSLDEQGALDLWREALKNTHPQFQKEVWSKFQEVQAELTRKELVPQVSRISAPSRDVLRIAAQSGLEVTVWSANGNETVAAVPPFLIERFGREGVSAHVIYDSVADWQKARARGDRVAESIAPEYQS